MNIGERFPETITRTGTVPPATGYSLVGPSSGVNGVASTNFAVFLTPFGSSVAGTVTVTPSDGGAGGTFTPASVGLTTASPSATFTYTPASTGTKTISVTNNGGLPDPASRSYAVAGPPATGYSLSGPSGGAVGVASTNFTVALTPAGGSVSGAVTITPTDLVAGGVFTPATIDLTTAAPSATFTYTPGIAGTRTISCSNNKGLTDPGNLSYAATAGGGLADGDLVATWPDSSTNGNNATQTGTARPTFKTNIVNGKPVVRFTSAGLSKLNFATPISSAGPFTLFVVAKGVPQFTFGASSGNAPAGIMITGGDSGGSNTAYFQNRAGYHNAIGNWILAFHIYTNVVLASDSFGGEFIDGSQPSVGGAFSAAPDNFEFIGSNGTSYSDTDIAEIILYQGGLALRAKLLVVLTVLITTGQIPSTEEADALFAAGDLVALEAYLIEHGVPVEQARDTLEPMAVGDRANIEKYLGTKYGITVAGGSAVQPDTVAGLVGWWKADSLG